MRHMGYQKGLNPVMWLRLCVWRDSSNIRVSIKVRTNWWKSASLEKINSCYSAGRIERAISDCMENSPIRQAVGGGEELVSLPFRKSFCCNAVLLCILPNCTDSRPWDCEASRICDSLF